MDSQFNTGGRGGGGGGGGGGGLTLPPPPLPTPPPPPQKSMGSGNPRYGIKYRAYSEEDMRKAAHAILEEGMSLRRASMTFNVPKTTLAERMGDKRPRLPPTTTSTAAGAGAGAATRKRKGGGGAASGGTRYTWTEVEMEQAIEAVQAGGESVREAARRFGVPPSNLNSRTRGRQPKDLKGDVSRLTLKQESLLADWASAQAALGFPPSKDEVYDLAERVMRKSAAAAAASASDNSNNNNNNNSGNKKLGKQWIGHWMRRWPTVEVLDWKSKQGLEAKRVEKRVPDLFDTSHFAVIDDGEQLRQQAPAD